MVEIELDPYDSVHLYEYTFDEMVAEFRPLREKEEKKYIQTKKYPIIFRLLPFALKKEYPSLSMSSVQIYATRLGLAKLSHDQRVNRLIDLCSEALDSITDNTFELSYYSMQKTEYVYATPTALSKKINISTTEEVQSFIVEKSDYLGLHESQLGVALFLIGIESASMNAVYHEKVIKELNAFWTTLDRRIYILHKYGFKIFENDDQ